MLLRLVEHADVLVEGYRAGVTERLGVGPDECLARNPALVYGRMTGWGSSGPLADKGGHDLNYISITGALEAMGAEGTPPPVPLNLIGDFGGGAMMLVMGVLAALLERTAAGGGRWSRRRCPTARSRSWRSSTRCATAVRGSRVGA